MLTFSYSWSLRLLYALFLALYVRVLFFFFLLLFLLFFFYSHFFSLMITSSIIYSLLSAIHTGPLPLPLLLLPRVVLVVSVTLTCSYFFLLLCLMFMSRVSLSLSRFRLTESNPDNVSEPPVVRRLFEERGRIVKSSSPWFPKLPWSRLDSHNGSNSLAPRIWSPKPYRDAIKSLPWPTDALERLRLNRCYDWIVQ